MAKVTLVFEDDPNGKDVNIDIESDPPFDENSESASLAQAMATHAVEYVMGLVNEDAQAMKPLSHAKASVRRYGGCIEDYMDIHTFIDAPKAAFADVRHRALHHNSYGCFLVEQMFGPYRYNSDGKMYCPRQLAEDHVVEDLGRIPSVEEWLTELPIKSWMDVKTVYKKRMKNDD